jgi:hypothetical protein
MFWIIEPSILCYKKIADWFNQKKGKRSPHLRSEKTSPNSFFPLTSRSGKFKLLISNSDSSHKTPYLQQNKSVFIEEFHDEGIMVKKPDVAGNVNCTVKHRK